MLTFRKNDFSKPRKHIAILEHSEGDMFDFIRQFFDFIRLFFAHFSEKQGGIGHIFF